MNDHELLRDHVRNGSQAAFTQLVERHLGLVYSAARRQVDAHLAEDISQQVFTLLARKAGRLGADTVLSAWLYRTARHLASETVRREVRRQRREQLAAETMNLSAPDAAWRQIEPLLDEAMASLSRGDHDAIVLRYFENKSLKEVAAALGTSEDAAQKRVARALDKLRAKFTRRGVTLSASALAAAIAGGAVHAAPAGLASSIATAALAGAAATAATGFTTHLLQAMAATKLKLIAAALAAAAVGTPLVVQYRANQSLRAENAALREQTDQQAEWERLRADNQRLAEQLKADTARTQAEHEDLLRLRGEVTRLRKQLRTNAAAATNAVPAETPQAPAPFTVALSARVGEGQTLVTGGWPTAPGKRTLALVTPTTDTSGTNTGRVVLITTRLVEAPQDAWAQLGLGDISNEGQQTPPQKILTMEQAGALMASLTNKVGCTVLSSPRVSMYDGGQARLLTGYGAVGAATVDFLPRLAPDGNAWDLQLNVQLTPDALRPASDGATAGGSGSPPNTP